MRPDATSRAAERGIFVVDGGSGVLSEKYFWVVGAATVASPDTRQWSTNVTGQPPAKSGGASAARVR
jgi:hypothetical protein